MEVEPLGAVIISMSGLIGSWILHNILPEYALSWEVCYTSLLCMSDY